MEYIYSSQTLYHHFNMTKIDGGTDSRRRFTFSPTTFKRSFGIKKNELTDWSKQAKCGIGVGSAAFYIYLL